MCAFKMAEVLLESGFIELGQEACLGGWIVAADVINQLTLVHGGITLRMEAVPRIRVVADQQRAAR